MELDIFKSIFLKNETSLDPSCAKLYFLPPVLKGTISDCQKPYIWLLKFFYLIQAMCHICVWRGSSLHKVV